MQSYIWDLYVKELSIGLKHLRDRSFLNIRLFHTPIPYIY